MWRPATAASALALALTTTAPAQGPAPRTAPPSTAGRAPAPAPASAAATATATPRRDDKVFQAGASLPEPVPIESLKGPTIALPNDPIEPYLLVRANGPFMVLAHTFRGPDATRYALALAKELREKEHLPAYIFQLKIQPSRSNIYDVPPTAPPHVPDGEAARRHPRIYDEAAVLVGDCPTIDDSEKLLHRVKKLHPVCLDGMPSFWAIRKGQGLSRAMLTTNPYRASQEIYPGKKAFDPFAVNLGHKDRKVDPLVAKINGGPRSVFNCPGQYTLVVADFTGRSTTVAQDTRFLTENKAAGQSPLATAADDAERLAELLGKDENLRRAGFQAYTFHDRSSSKVVLGAFQSPEDPKAAALREVLEKKMRNQIATGKKVPVNGKSVEDVMFLTPSGTLMPVPQH